MHNKLQGGVHVSTNDILKSKRYWGAWSCTQTCVQVHEKTCTKTLILEALRVFKISNK